MDKHDEEIRREAVRTVLFVFVLFSVAEIVAPYFKISFTDPLLITTFVTGTLAAILTQGRGKCTRAHGMILVLRDDCFHDFCVRLPEIQQDSLKISVADTADDAVRLLKSDAKSNQTLVGRVRKLIGR